MVFMRTQWVFPLTQCHSCALNGCSGAVPTHSLVFMRTQGIFRGCSILTHCHSHALTNVQEVFNMCSAWSSTDGPMTSIQICKAHKGPINLISISIKCHFFGFAKQEDMMSVMLVRWSQCSPIRLATKN